MSMIFSYCNAQINLFMNMQNNIMNIETMYALLQCINICIIYYICIETTEILRERRETIIDIALGTQKQKELTQSVHRLEVHRMPTPFASPIEVIHRPW